jgi:hypothetical protein
LQHFLVEQGQWKIFWFWYHPHFQPLQLWNKTIYHLIKWKTDVFRLRFSLIKDRSFIPNSFQRWPQNVGSEVSVAAVKSSIFWNTILCSPLRINDIAAKSRSTFNGLYGITSGRYTPLWPQECNLLSFLSLSKQEKE